MLPCRPGVSRATLSLLAGLSAVALLNTAAASAQAHVGIIRYVDDAERIDVLDDAGAITQRLGPPVSWGLGNTSRLAWSRDGQRIAFSGHLFGSDPATDNAITLFVADLATGGGVRQLGIKAPANLQYWSPSWSADGASLVVEVRARQAESSRLMTIRLADGHLRSVPTPPPPAGLTASDWEPAWSPNGAQLAYTRSLSRGTRRIRFETHVIDLVTSRLLARVPRAVEPAWSPDGSRLAVTTFRPTCRVASISDCDSDIAVVPSVGAPKPRALTAGPADDDGATWSPDGSHVMFDSDREDPRRASVSAFVVDAAGTCGVPQLVGSLPGLWPVWSPIPGGASSPLSEPCPTGPLSPRVPIALTRGRELLLPGPRLGRTWLQYWVTESQEAWFSGCASGATTCDTSTTVRLHSTCDEEPDAVLAGLTSGTWRRRKGALYAIGRGEATIVAAATLLRVRPDGPVSTGSLRQTAVRIIDGLRTESNSRPVLRAVANDRFLAALRTGPGTSTTPNATQRRSERRARARLGKALEQNGRRAACPEGSR